MLPKPTILIPMILVMIVTSGCDDRATRIAREAADRQAQQNTSMADLNKEVASGTHQLVEADAEARKEIVGVHRDLQSERSRLDTSWSQLESERRKIAGQRRTESMLTTMTPLVGGILLTAMLLGFCWLIFVSACRDSDVEFNDLLVEEILTVEPSIILDDSPSLLVRTQTGNQPEGP